MNRFHKVVTLTFWATLGLVVAGGLWKALGAGCLLSRLANMLGMLVTANGTERHSIPVDEAGEPYYLKDEVGSVGNTSVNSIPPKCGSNI